MLKGLVHVSRAVCCGFVVGAGLLAEPAIAWASSCNASPPYVCIASYSRSTSGGKPYTDARPPEYDPGGINYSDCAKDITIDFTLTVEGAPSGDHLEVWVGPLPTPDNGFGCEADAARQKGGTCWPLAPVGSISPQTTTTVTVRAQDIAANLGNATLPTTYTAVTDAKTACQAQTTPGPVDLDIYFMLIATDGTYDTSQVAGAYHLEAATLGPYAPALAPAVMNDGYVQLSWTPPNDPSIVGYYVYCQNFGKQDAGVTDSAAVDTGINGVDGGSVGGQCSSALLSSSDVYTKGATSPAGSTEAGKTADTGATDAEGIIDEAAAAEMGLAGISQVPLNPCASPTDALDGSMTGGATSSSATIPLTNYDYYVFAVAAIDGLGNVGPVSDLTCGTPGPLDDFWTVYTTDGGLAGGGYCALEAVGSPGGSAVMGLGVGVVAITLVRRRRRPR